MPLDYTKTVPRAQIPAPDAVIPGPAHECCLVWGECDARDSPSMTDERHEALSCLAVPQANSVVEAPRCNSHGITRRDGPPRDCHAQNLAANFQCNTSRPHVVVRVYPLLHLLLMCPRQTSFVADKRAIVYSKARIFVTGLPRVPLHCQLAFVRLGMPDLDSADSQHLTHRSHINRQASHTFRERSYLHTIISASRGQPAATRGPRHAGDAATMRRTHVS